MVRPHVRAAAVFGVGGLLLGACGSSDVSTTATSDVLSCESAPASVELSTDGAEADTDATTADSLVRRALIDNDGTGIEWIQVSGMDLALRESPISDRAYATATFNEQQRTEYGLELFIEAATTADLEQWGAGENLVLVDVRSVEYKEIEGVSDVYAVMAGLELGADGSVQAIDRCHTPSVEVAEFLSKEAVIGQSAAASHATDLLIAKEPAVVDAVREEIFGPAVELDWATASPDIRVITPGLMPDEEFSVLEPFNMLVRIPNDWARQDSVLCTHVPTVGWNNSCHLLSSGPGDGPIPLSGLIDTRSRVLSLYLSLDAERLDVSLGHVFEIEVPPADTAGFNGVVDLIPVGGFESLDRVHASERSANPVEVELIPSEAAS